MLDAMLAASVVLDLLIYQHFVEARPGYENGDALEIRGRCVHVWKGVGNARSVCYYCSRELVKTIAIVLGVKYLS